MAVDKAKLDLLDKLDFSNTLISMKYRSRQRWEKAEYKDKVVEAHHEALDDEAPTSIDFEAFGKAAMRALIPSTEAEDAN